MKFISIPTKDCIVTKERFFTTILAILFKTLIVVGRYSLAAIYAKNSKFAFEKGFVC